MKLLYVGAQHYLVRTTHSSYPEILRRYNLDDTLKLFGPGLIEHRALLEALEQLENGINDEWDRWQRWKVKDERLLPAEALFNLSTLGQISMTAIASITLILQDWGTLPPDNDAEFSRFAPPTFWEYAS